MSITLIVTDGGPLITLAVADALDTLKLLGARVIIPDMVEIGATEEFAEFSAMPAVNPALRLRNRGEMAG